MVVSLVFVINSLVSLFLRLSWKATALPHHLSNKVALFIYLCRTQHNFLVRCYHISMFVYYLFLNMVVLVSFQIYLSVFFFSFLFHLRIHLIFFFHWIRLSPCVNTFVDYFWTPVFIYVFFFFSYFWFKQFCSVEISFLNSVFNFPCNYLFCLSIMSAFFCII